MNLYTSIDEILNANGKTMDDIDWIECADEDGHSGMYLVDKDVFTAAIKNTDYDELGYWSELNPNLRIYGKNRSFIIRIGEYDGNMYPEYISFETEKPKKSRKILSFSSAHMKNNKLLKSLIQH